MARLFYSIFDRSGRREYHVSRIRLEAEQGSALNQAIGLDSPLLATKEAEWMAEAALYEATRVPYRGVA